MSFVFKVVNLILKILVVPLFQRGDESAQIADRGQYGSREVVFSEYVSAGLACTRLPADQIRLGWKEHHI
jgi:hypothetical protein